jgi:23S rRNA pseudouridine1911/1915/1917 synthase
MRIRFSRNNEEESKGTDSKYVPQNLRSAASAGQEPKRVLYYDKDILVAVKPAGILSQPGKTDSSDLISYLRDLTPNIISSGESPKLVHRLDRPVGGILLFTRSCRAERYYSPEGVRQHMKKTYIAIVDGNIPERSGTLTDYLAFDRRTNLSSVVTQDQKNPVKAVLHYEVLQDIEADEAHGSLQVLRIELLTGRHHQIRVQLANAGCPIIGDTKYHPEYIGKEGWHRIALFADSLKVRHLAGEVRYFTADPVIYEPEAFSLLR